MRLISDLEPGYWQKDVDEFLDLLQQALVMLDTLGTIEATVGGLVMTSKASKTFEVHAHLQRHLSSLLEQRAIEKRQVGR